jgi:hypothetical protein
MARFSGNWEQEFRPNWELQTDYSSAVGAGSNPGAGTKQVMPFSSLLIPCIDTQ